MTYFFSNGFDVITSFSNDTADFLKENSWMIKGMKGKEDQSLLFLAWVNE